VYLNVYGGVSMESTVFPLFREDREVSRGMHRFSIAYIKGLDIELELEEDQSESCILHPYAVFLWLDDPVEFVCDFQKCLEAYSHAESLAHMYELYNDTILVSEGCDNILSIELAHLNSCKGRR
jgi:hypothetical protein